MSTRIKSATLVVRVTPDLYEAIADRSRAEERSMGSWVRFVAQERLRSERVPVAVQ